jgi:hypothetical protein
MIKGSGEAGPFVDITAFSIAEDASIGDAVGTLSVVNGSGVYTFSITADPDTKFALNVDGVTLELADTLDYETATSHSVTIEADNGVDDPISRIITIFVTDVDEGGGGAGEPIGLLLILTKAA